MLLNSSWGEERRQRESARIFSFPGIRTWAQHRYFTAMHSHAYSDALRESAYYASVSSVSVIISVCDIFLRARSFKPLNLLNICAYRIWIKHWQKEEHSPPRQDMRVNWKQRKIDFPRYTHLKGFTVASIIRAKVRANKWNAVRFTEQGPWSWYLEFLKNLYGVWLFMPTFVHK